MRAAYATRISPDDPLAGLEFGEVDEPVPPADDWVVVDVRASALNHHDLWSLHGVGLSADQLPMILGCDAAGVDPDGNEVVVHAVVAGRHQDRTGEAASGDPKAGDETMDPARTLLSEKWPGTLAQRVRVPRRSLVPKPAELTFAE